MAGSRSALRRTGLLVLAVSLSAFSFGIPGAGYWGYTAWDCSEPRSYGWVRSDRLATHGQVSRITMGDVYRAIGIARHEEQHVADDSASGLTCAQLNATLLFSLSYLRRAEIRGKCAEAMTLEHFGVIPRRTWRGHTAQSIARDYPNLFVDSATVHRLTEDFCKDIRV